MVDKVNISGLDRCVVAYARRHGIPQSRFIRKTGIDTYETVSFYFNHLAVRRACFSKAGLRSPITAFGHDAKEEAFARKERVRMFRVVHGVKQNMRSIGMINYRRAKVQLSVLWDLVSKIGMKDAESRYGDILSLGRQLKKYGQFDDGKKIGQSTIDVRARHFLRKYKSHRRRKRQFKRLLGRIRRILKKIPQYVNGTDAYYINLASRLGRKLRQEWKWKDEGVDEHSAIQASILNRGSCTEFFYKHYSLCIMAGIPKKKLRYFEATKDEKGKGFVNKKKKPVGHVCLAIKMKKRYGERNLYLVDPARNRFSNPKYMGTHHRIEGAYGGYFDTIGKVLLRQGKLHESIRMSQLAVRFLPTKDTYAGLLVTLKHALKTQPSLVKPSELASLVGRIKRIFPSWRKGQLKAINLRSLLPTKLHW